MNREIKFRVWASNDANEDGKMYYPGMDVEAVVGNHKEPGAFLINQFGVLLLARQSMKVESSPGLARWTNNDIQVMQFTGLLDKNKKEIYEGDIVTGYQRYMRGDGYKSKKFPDAIKVICVVEYIEGSFEHPKVIGPIPEHKEAYENKNYRLIEYLLRPRHLGSCYYNDETKEWDIPGDGKTCPDIEIIGNIHQNPELLKQ